VPAQPPVAIARRDHPRTVMDGSVLHVHGYPLPRDGSATPVLVVTSDDGVSYATGDAPARIVIDRAGVSWRPVPNLIAVGRSGPAPAPDSSQRSYEVPAYHTTALAALDLDGNGVPEVIYTGDDQAGAFVAAYELACVGDPACFGVWIGH